MREPGMKILTEFNCHSRVGLTRKLVLLTSCTLGFFVNLCVISSPVDISRSLTPPARHSDILLPVDLRPIDSKYPIFPILPRLDEDRTLAKKYQSSNKRVVILDYDGTLAEFHSDPEQAVPSESLLTVLKRLNEDKRTTVAIISGRDRLFLEKHFGRYRNFFLSAEHGAFERPRGGTKWKSVVNIDGLDSSWKKQVKRIMEEVQLEGTEMKHENVEGTSNEIKPEKVEGTSIEIKSTGVVFHYRSLASVDKSKADKIAQKLMERLANFRVEGVDLIMEHDAAAIDIRPAQFTKGAFAVSTWLQEPKAELVLCLGDGHTDEAMFKSLHDFEKNSLSRSATLITAHVEHSAGKRSLAKYRIADVEAVNNLLRSFYGLPPQSVSSKKILTKS